MRVTFDHQTSLWFKAHQDAQVTVVKCERCGQFYKADFTHVCERMCGTCKHWDDTDTTSIGCRCTCKEKRHRSIPYTARTQHGCSHHMEK